MAEELQVVLRKSENFTYGFSLLGTAGLPHVIYDILENSPAAECGEVEAGDVIVKVNGTDVHRYTTKEVLKCLRLSQDPVTLDLKRDPKIKAKVRHYLAQTNSAPGYTEFPDCDLNASIRLSPCASPTPSSPLLYQQQQQQQQANRRQRQQQQPPSQSPPPPASSNATTQCRKSRIPTIIRSPVQQHQHHNNSHSTTINTTNNSHHANHHAVPSPPQQTRSIRAPSASILGRADTFIKSPAQPTHSPMTAAQHAPHLNGSPLQQQQQQPQYNNHHQQQQQYHHHNNGSASSATYATTASNNTTAAAVTTHKKQRFEAYMMTGDLILNLSRTEQSSGLIGQAIDKKVADSLRDSPKQPRSKGATSRIASRTAHNGSAAGIAATALSGCAPHAKGESSLSSPSLSDDDTSDSVNSIRKQQLQQQQKQRRPVTASSRRSPNGGVGGGADDVDCVGAGRHGAEKTTMMMMNKSAANSDTSQNQLSATNNGAENSHTTSQPRRPNADDDNDDYYCDDGDDEDQSLGSSTAARSDNLGSPDAVNCFSVPTSPTSLTTPPTGAELSAAALAKRDTATSAPTSPEAAAALLAQTGTAPLQLHQQQQQQHHQQHHQQPEVVYRRSHNGGAAGGGGGGAGTASAGVNRRNDAAGFRTSRSEDHLQHTQRDILGAAIPIDIDEDVNSSLNTLLDTRQDSEDSQSSSDRDRIVWTYNAPVHPADVNQQQQQQQQPPIQHSSSSHSSSISSSPQRSDSPASPTSVSSSVMSSNSGSRIAANATGGAGNGVGQQGSSSSTAGNTISGGGGGGNGGNGGGGGGGGGGNGGSSGGGNGGNLQSLMCPLNNGDHSVSEAVSNISSPDYQDDDNLLSSKDMQGMAISDASDSDSTILVSDAGQKQRQHQQQQQHQQGDHKIVIKVRGMEQQQQQQMGYEELSDSDDVAGATDDVATQMMFAGANEGRESSPPVSDDGSDVDSLHSYHYSPKAVDIPSAVRLAKRLYGLDGFKKSDVSRHLSKNNDFSRAVADEYLKYFQFANQTLDEALRQFLQQFALSGETQERERVLVHFSRRFLDCNPHTYNSQDAVHTLTCAIMLLNTDLHGQNIGRKMTCTEFIDNLADLNDGDNFPKDVLKSLYQAIKGHPLEWALDDESPDTKPKADGSNMAMACAGGALNPFVEQTPMTEATEYKKGYVMRKCCYDSNNKKTPFGKRSWKMFYCTLRDLVLYLHKDEHGFKKNQMTDNVHNAIRIHHALASKANDYTKKQHVFRLQTADQSEYLFQTSDSKELQSWIDTVNFVCAAFSAPPLEGAVGSQKRFQRPLLPSSPTKLLIRQQLVNHQNKVAQLEATQAEHKRATIPNKGLPLQNYKEKDAYLQYELNRYRTYVFVLSGRIFMDDEEAGASGYVNELLHDMTDVAAVAAANAASMSGTLDEELSDDQQASNASGTIPSHIYQPLTVNLSGTNASGSSNSSSSKSGKQQLATNRYMVSLYDEDAELAGHVDGMAEEGEDLDEDDEDVDGDDVSEGARIIDGRPKKKSFFQM